MFFSSTQSKYTIPTSIEKDELISTCESIAQVLHDHGYDNPALSVTPRPYPKDFQIRLAHLKVFRELICGPDPKNHKDLLWRYFGKMKFTPPSDVLDRIEDGDIIEIYDMNNEQIFRNLNYFDVVSMSVEDLVSINWKRDFKRSAKITLQMVEMILRFATGFFPKTFECDRVPVHTVQELIAKRHRIELNLKLIIPLKQNGRCAALMGISRARIISVGT